MKMENGMSHVPGVLQYFQQLLTQQAQEGMETYGQPLTNWNNRDAVDDVARELVDAVVYLLQIQNERELTLIALAKIYYGEWDREDLEEQLPWSLQQQLQAHRHGVIHPIPELIRSPIVIKSDHQGSHQG